MVGVEGVEPPFLGPRPRVIAVLLHPDNLVPTNRIERFSAVLQTAAKTTLAQSAKLFTIS